MTKIIGLTGGIGSGKSTIANYIASKKIPVYIADDAAKEIMAKKAVVDEVVATFGTEVVLKNHTLDRKVLAAIVFDDEDKLNKLNTIIHPKVQEHFKNWLVAHKDYPFIIKEVAILFETNGHLNCDKVILVTAPLERRIQRVIHRDGSTKEEVLIRMNNQMPEEEKVKLADYIVENIDLQNTFNQVDELLKKIKNS